MNDFPRLVNKILLMVLCGSLFNLGVRTPAWGTEGVPTGVELRRMTRAAAAGQRDPAARQGAPAALPHRRGFATVEPSIPARGSEGTADTGPPVVETWWFWTAVGVALAGTITAVALSGQKNTTPRTTLGNQEAF